MWFFEELYNDTKLGIDGKLIHKEKSKFQEAGVYDTVRLGRVLTLNNIIQIADRECIVYNEMISHPVLLTHPKPENILILGAGNYGILNEVLKHRIKKACVVETDGMIPRLGKKFFPDICGKAFDDKRVEIIIDDCAKFVSETKEKFDAVLINYLSPERNPASAEFYRDIKTVLKETGLVITYAGSSMWQTEKITAEFQSLRKIFPVIRPLSVSIPARAGGPAVFFIASKKLDPIDTEYDIIVSRYRKLGMETNYYNPEIQFAGMMLPNYLRRALK